MSFPNSLPRDPTREHQTSAVFQPFPASLLRRLTPSPPQPYLSPIPSASDISDRRYSDASDLSSLSDSDHRLANWRSRQSDFPLPPPPIHQDRLPSHLSERTPTSPSPSVLPIRPTASVPTTPPKPKPPQPADHAPATHQQHHKRRLGRAVWRLLTRRRKRMPQPSSLNPIVSLPVVNRVHSAPPVETVPDATPDLPSAQGSGVDSLSALRLRVEREVEMDNMAADFRRESKVTWGRGELARGRGIGDGMRKSRGLWCRDSGSVGSMPAAYGPGMARERASTFSMEREACSFGGYRRIIKFGEGSSVSSCEERDDDGEEGHLYLSRRQMRAMQY